MEIHRHELKYSLVLIDASAEGSQDDPDPPAISTNSHSSLLVFATSVLGLPTVGQLIHPFTPLPQIAI
jgi:hypothetical protein